MAKDQTPRIALTVVLGALVYFGIGAVAYWLFYSHYDEHGVSSDTAFKVNFTLTLAGHVALTLASSVVIARLLHARIGLALAALGVLMALLLVPSLRVLALVNDCLGVAFPWDGGCPE